MTTVVAIVSTCSYTYNVGSCCTEPDYEFEKELNDADAYEKETAEFECEVNDEEAPVQWFREDKVSLHDVVSLVSHD